MSDRTGAGKGAEMTYRRGNDLDLDAVIDLYRASTLGLRRPVDDSETMADILRHGNLVISAWDGSLLVGIARSLTDSSYVAHLSDLAVRESHQHLGIGTELIRRTREAMGPRSMLVLLAAPAAFDYYPRLGFSHHPQAWILRAGEPLRGERHPGQETPI